MKAPRENIQESTRRLSGENQQSDHKKLSTIVDIVDIPSGAEEEKDTSEAPKAKSEDLSDTDQVIIF